MIPQANVLTVKEVSAYLRIHTSTVYRLLKNNEIPAFKIGSDWRFNIEAIDRWRMQQGAGLVGIKPRRPKAPIPLRPLSIR